MSESSPRRIVRKLRLAARIPVGQGIIGCRGAKLEETSRPAEAALDLIEPDGSLETIAVTAGDEFEIGGILVRVDEVHPWNPPHPAGATLSWEG